MQNRMRKISIILMIGIIATTCSLTCCAQNHQEKKDLINLKEQSICILEETEDYIVYLTKLVRIVQNLGDEKIHYAGGEEFFLRYETLTISQNENKSVTLKQAILHCKPERIATLDGRSYDTAAFYILPESSMFYKDDSCEELIDSDRKWSSAGLYNDDGIANRIAKYYEKYRESVVVHQENLDYYTDNFW